MSETCGTCGRPKGDYHRRPVAGECTAPDPTDYTVSLQCTSIALRKAQEDIAAAEERGRRAGIEAMQLGTCRVYVHGCADGRAIEPRPNWREYALPHPKRDNCTDWEALAPRDSGKDRP